MSTIFNSPLNAEVAVATPTSGRCGAASVVSARADAGACLSRSLTPSAISPKPPSCAESFRVRVRPRSVRYAFDDSVFIDDAYAIKGVPGRMLVYMLDTWRETRRREFTNRELRLAPSIRLPDIKDNLETRLLLLRRRLDEKASPVRLVRTDRGRLALELAGTPQLERAAD